MPRGAVTVTVTSTATLPSALSTQHQQPLVLVLVLGDFVIGDANGALDQGFLQLTGSCSLFDMFSCVDQS